MKYELLDIAIGMDGTGDITVDESTIRAKINEDLRLQGYRHWGYTLEQIDNQRFEITSTCGKYKMEHIVGTDLAGYIIAEPWNHSNWQRMPKPAEVKEGWLNLADKYTTADTSITVKHYLDVEGWLDFDGNLFNFTPYEQAHDWLAAAFKDALPTDWRVKADTHTDTEQKTFDEPVNVTTQERNGYIEITFTLEGDYRYVNADWSNLLNQLETWLEIDYLEDVMEDFSDEWLWPYSVAYPEEYLEFEDFIKACLEFDTVPVYENGYWRAVDTNGTDTVDVLDLTADTLIAFWQGDVFIDADGLIWFGNSADDAAKAFHANTILELVQADDYDGDVDWFYWQMKADAYAA